MANKRTPSQQVLDAITLKKLRYGFGHDKGGAYADVYFNGQLLGTFEDDGWGAGGMLREKHESRAEAAEKFLRGIGFDKYIFENGYDFMGSRDKVTFTTMVDEVLSYHINQKEQAKVDAKMAKASLTKVLAGNPKTPNTYVEWNFKRPLAGIPVVEMIAALTRIKSQLKPGEVILNKNLDHVLESA